MTSTKKAATFANVGRVSKAKMVESAMMSMNALQMKEIPSQANLSTLIFVQHFLFVPNYHLQFVRIHLGHIHASVPTDINLPQMENKLLDQRDVSILMNVLYEGINNFHRCNKRATQCNIINRKYKFSKCRSIRHPFCRSKCVSNNTVVISVLEL